MGFVTHLNIELKARCPDPDETLTRLLALGARLEGVDAQTDVYYQCRSGRLKLRRGIIENSLISYHRPTRAVAARPTWNWRSCRPTGRSTVSLMLRSTGTWSWTSAGTSCGSRT